MYCGGTPCSALTRSSASRCARQNATPSAMRWSVRKIARYCHHCSTRSAGRLIFVDDLRLRARLPQHLEDRSAVEPVAPRHLRGELLASCVAREGRTGVVRGGARARRRRAVHAGECQERERCVSMRDT